MMQRANIIGYDVVSSHIPRHFVIKRDQSRQEIKAVKMGGKQADA
jgi:hypothetical protein